MKLSGEERNAILFEAMQLLMDDNLVWSPDFEEIRALLGYTFLRAMSVPQLAELLTPIGVRIVKTYG
jgi:hypothetical protein